MKTLIAVLILFASIGSNAQEALNSPKPQTPKVAYYCGHITQKGTPCQRRVKAKGEHCYQHQTPTKWETAQKK